jgi:hypothetical protein
MINKVGYTRPASHSKRTKRASKSDRSDFAAALSDNSTSAETAASEGMHALSSPAAIGLLSIQQVSDEETAQSKAKQHGRNTLALLEKLRDGLLSGTLPRHTLTQLERMVEQERTLTSDPALNAVLDEIALRAAVELAKLEKSGYTP